MSELANLCTTALLGTLLVVATGCSSPLDTSAERSKPALGAGTEGVLRQGWTVEERETWYRATQGSRLLPRSWFHALERADDERPFAALDHLASFGFLAPEASGAGAGAGDAAGGDAVLPIGFTSDRQADGAFRTSGLRWYADQPGGENTAEPWIGLNCAACHTARLSHAGVTTTIDGGPNLLDFQSFIESLDASLAATRADGTKWERFAAAVLGERDTAENRTLLEGAFDELLAWQARTETMNETPVRYGAGRLDAVGHILNKVLMFNGASIEDGNPANAPVSYPFLWDIWRQEKVQWNGVAENSRLKTPGDPIEYGALGRNAGEVLGVFGEVLVKPNEGLADTIRGYESSVRTRNLMRMELLLQGLERPAWPAHFPPIDEALADIGETLFERDCESCHLTPDTQVKGEPTERMVAFENTPAKDLTDIWMACNAYVHDGPTGPMAGTKDNTGEVMGEREPVANMLATAVKGALIGDAGELVKEGLNNFVGIRRLPEIDRAPDPFDPRGNERTLCLTTTDVEILAYKARPLDGIWATAPYLHNGSVRSLYELLLPAEERSPTFALGSREYDPIDVGYVSAAGDGLPAFVLDTSIEGNRNTGHEYGVAGLDEAGRRALIEYMKTL